MLKDERAGDTLKLFGTGRDVRDLELGLCFRQNPIDWVLTDSSVGQFKPSRDRELLTVATFAVGVQSWEGTATELAALLQQTSPDCVLRPNALVRILNAAAGLTEKQYGFTCGNQKRSASRGTASISTAARC